MSTTSHRVLQYLLIILIAAAAGGGYWYWKNARAAQQVTDNRPSFEAPLTTDLNLTAGQGIATYSRADGADRRATVTDFEGLIRPVKAGEARFDGARRVENLVGTTSENFSNAAWTISSASLSPGIADPSNGTSAMRMTATGANGFFSRGVASVTGRTYTHSIWIRRVSGSGNVILHGDDIGNTVVTTTTSWKRFSNTFTATDGNSYAGVRLGTSGDVIDVAFAQMEGVTGQTNQNPSEYVSVGVKTAFPYHGAGVDGVKYFSTQNGNTVASNVVTEATGTAIPTSTLKGYLAEGARTNLALQSEALNDAGWVKTASGVTADAVIAPSGAVSADKLTEDATTASHYVIGNSISITSGLTYVLSAYVKSAENSKAGLWVTGSYFPPAGRHAWFDLSSGTVGGAQSGVTASIISVGGGWYRCQISVVATGTGSSNFGGLYLTQGGYGDSYAGTNGNGVYVWGAQLEQATFASSYIPTTTASVTRAVDNLKYIGSSNFNNTAGTTTVDVTTEWTGNDGNGAFFIDDSSVFDRMSIWHWSGLNNLITVDRNGGGGTRNNVDYAGSTITAGTIMHLGQRWTSTANALFRDGSLRGSDTTLTLPYDAISGIAIGLRGDVNSPAFANIKNVKSWKKALTDTELNNLTSATEGIATSAVKKTTLKNTPNTTGLVGYWSFEDGSGTKAEDFSPTGTNTGTLTNGPTWTTGKFGSAVNFDGTDDYIDIPVSTNLDANFFRNPNWTISMWVKPTLSGDATQELFMGVWHKPRILLSSPGGTLTFSGYVSTVYTPFIVKASYFSANTWTHLTLVSNGTSYLLYKNGIQSASAAYTQIDATATLFRLGADGSGNGRFSGVMDDVRIYNRALSQAEITALYGTTAAKVNTSQNTQLTNGLVGLWSFNGPDLSGTTAYDRSGQGNNGTLTNGPTVYPGKVGQALRFDGTDDYITVPDSASLDIGTAATFSVWVRPTTITFGSGAAKIFRKWQSGVEDKQLSLSSGGNICFYLHDTFGGSCLTASSQVTANAWNHIVGRYDGSTAKIYVNGVEVASKAASGDVSDGTGAFEIGYDPNGPTGYFPGQIDESRIYNRALSAAEITALYNLGR
jgi:hypothetical protein